MDKYPKLFVLMSLFYLFIGASIGLLNAFSIAVTKDMIFMHVHYNLLGFMMMMIIGIAYHILPRFTGSFIYFPRLIPIHFWVTNLGIILLTTGFHLKKTFPKPGTTVLIIGGLLAYSSILMFIINIGLTLLRPKSIFAEKQGTNKPTMSCGGGK